MAFGDSFGGWLGNIGASLGGSALTASMAADEAHKQRRFLRKMRETAYQTTMEDMRKAGLNPILAYRSGPTPLGGSPSIPQIPDFGAAASRGISTAQAGRRTRGQTGLMGAQMDAANAQADAARAAAGKSATETEGIRRAMDANVANAENAERVSRANATEADIRREIFERFGTQIVAAEQLSKFIGEAGGALGILGLGGLLGRRGKGGKGPGPTPPKQDPRGPKNFGLGSPGGNPGRAVPGSPKRRPGLSEREEGFLNDFEGRPSPRRRYQR